VLRAGVLACRRGCVQTFMRAGVVACKRFASRRTCVLVQASLRLVMLPCLRSVVLACRLACVNVCLRARAYFRAGVLAFRRSWVQMRLRGCV
jgi:hypothetical protein